MRASLENVGEHGDDAAASAAHDPLSVPAEVKATIRLLIAEDERVLRDGLAAALRSQGYTVTAVPSGVEALEALKRSRFDIVVTDLFMMPVSGLEVLRAARQHKSDTIVIVITGNPTVTTSVEAIRAGAWDYLPKPFSATHVQILLGRATHVVLQSREMRQLREQLLRRGGAGGHPTLLGTSPAFYEALDTARKVAPTDASVFLVGESGTGKELFAQFIHQQSQRASKSMVALNCAALPEPLLESEMFGHRRGAFTGADRDKAGLLEMAHGGTLFLDELTEMPAGLQAKLLRVLQDGVVRRVGSERTDSVVDVRFISAMNRDPQQAVADRTLRADLFYRLRVVPIRIPPLRERREDIPMLTAHFLAYFWERHRRPGTTLPKFSRASTEFLRTRTWPGNVRELKNVIENVAVLTEPGHEITPNEIPLEEDPDTPGRITDALTPDILREGYHAAKEKLNAEFERVYLRRLVERAGGNLARAARAASVDRTTLYRLLEKHSIGVRRDAASDARDVAGEAK